MTATAVASPSPNCFHHTRRLLKEPSAQNQPRSKPILTMPEIEERAPMDRRTRLPRFDRATATLSGGEVRSASCRTARLQSFRCALRLTSPQLAHTPATTKTDQVTRATPRRTLARGMTTNDDADKIIDLTRCETTVVRSSPAARSAAQEEQIFHHRKYLRKRMKHPLVATTENFPSLDPKKKSTEVDRPTRCPYAT